MANELTSSEKEKVFSMYIGSDFLYENGEPEQLAGTFGGFIYSENADDSGEGTYGIDDCKLMLTPLSKITDKHAAGVLVALGADKELLRDFKKEFKGKFYDAIKLLEDTSMTPPESDVHPFRVFGCYQYLISQHYAVPLWFGLKHKANGKNAFDLGLAIPSIS